MDDQKRDDEAADDELSDDEMSDATGGLRISKNPDEDAGPDGRFIAS